MTVVPALLIALLAAVSIGLVLWPLLLTKGSHESLNGQAVISPGTNRGEYDTHTSAGRDELLARRDVIYATLRDVEFDRQTGKLAEDDYQALRRRYVQEAAAVLRRLDAVSPPIDAQIEAEIETAVSAERSRLAGVDEPALAGATGFAEAGDVLPPEETRPANLEAPMCPGCGRSVRPGDEFCVHCGISLTDVCPECGAPRRVGAAFCARCGAVLKANDVSRDGITQARTGKPGTDDVS